MEWYKLVLEQIQPIHIGKFNWGVVSETEIFIPGQTVWGALVNVYLQKNKTSSSKIEDIQKSFETITNFFPSFDGENILKPAYKNEEFAYKINGISGNEITITEEEFRLYFVSADFKTAIDPFTTTAKEEQLYEFEYILPKPKKEFQEKVKDLSFKRKLHWIGLIKVEDSETENFLEKNPEIFVGGDTRYGYGLLKIIECKKAAEELKNWHLNNEGEFEYDDKIPLRNFLEFESHIKFTGEIKLIPELEFTNRNPYVKDAKFYITPGSILKNNPSSNLILRRGKFISET